MSTLSAVGLSGMNAAQAVLRASAANIANVSPPGYRRVQVEQGTAPDGEVTTSFSRAAQAGDDLVGDVVSQLVAKNQFMASLAVFKTGDSLTGTLLDAVG